MSRRIRVSIALGLLSGSAGKFVPFADVEELKPTRIEQFCAAETFLGADGRSQVRRCKRHFKKQLEDGSDIELGWQMDVDPDSILSLDTEAEHGVRLTRCTKDRLEMELPESHARHAAEGKLIVGSRFVHNCPHLGDRHLYHRVRRVHSQQWGDTMVPGSEAKRTVSFVHLGTEELSHIAHAVPSLSFHFSWMPEEARDVQAFPEMRTDYGINRKHLERQRKGRRLFDFPKSFSMPHGVDEDTGGFKSGGVSDGSFDTKNGVLNLMPKQLSNFGWNWNFFMNTTQEPNFDMDLPGVVGKLKVRKPFVKVHSGIYLNFSSEFGGLTLPPKVRWTWGIKGHGRVQARVLGSMNTTADAGTDPFHAFKLPVLEELENPVWFEKIDLATGTLPISMEPGFKFAAQMYHHGRFHGAIGTGGKTHGTINPSLSYDSVRGFDTKFEGKLTDTDLWPPLWMIFTKAFEMGFIMKPSVLMRGDFAGLERATMAMEGRPYANLTVTRRGGKSYEAEELKTLTVYPMRVMGIDTVEFSKRYMVRVTANGQKVETSPEVNWGQVEFHDQISKFDCGQLPQKTLMNPKESRITVSLIEVDDSTGTEVQTNLGTGAVTCGSQVNGECTPSPANVAILGPGGDSVATVQMAILWETDPDPWFASKIRGLGFSFPEVVLLEEVIVAAFPDAQSLNPGQEAQSVQMHLIRGGQTYVVDLQGKIGNEQSALAGKQTVEFGPGFTDTWLPCPSVARDCESPRLELYAGHTLIGTADVPNIEFTSSTAMQGTASSGGFMAGPKSEEMNVPSQVALTAPGQPAATVSLVTMNTRVDMTLESSMFLSPRSQQQVQSGGIQKLAWTVAGVDRSKEYTFELKAYSMATIAPTNMEEYAGYRKIDGKVLIPVAKADKQITATCEPLANKGLPSSAAPCSFSYNYPVKSPEFSAGDVIVVMVVWTGAANQHVLYSPPMQVTGGPAKRRLSEEVEGQLPVGVESHATPRRLWSRDSWNARVAKHSESCNKRDLHFNLGLGMMMRGKVDSISVPHGFPMIGGLSEQPELTTGFRNVAAIKPGEDVEEAFGGENGLLCQVGLCQGALPGCSVGGPKKLNFPRLVFNFSRPFHFDSKSSDHFDGMMKQALAYAFSTLPEMVDVVVKELNSTNGFFPRKQTTTPKPEDWWSNGEEDRSRAPAPAPSLDWPTQAVSRSPAPAPMQAQAQKDDSLTDAFNKWWGGDEGRRLSSAEVVGSADALPVGLEKHQARLEFNRGVPFVIDRPLVNVMLQNGYFKGLEDVDDGKVAEHGPIEITGFYVDSGMHDAARRVTQPPPATAVPWWAAPIAGGFALAALLAAAALARGRGRARPAWRYSPGPSGDIAGSACE